jgi:hypothetical protein
LKDTALLYLLVDVAVCQPLLFLLLLPVRLCLTEATILAAASTPTTASSSAAALMHATWVTPAHREINSNQPEHCKRYKIKSAGTERILKQLGLTTLMRKQQQQQQQQHLHQQQQIQPCSSWQ